MLPILFTLKTPWGAQPIYSYGVLLGVSLIAGYPLVVRMAARLDRSREELIGNAYLITALCGVIGSRLLYVLENRELLEESGGAWFDITSGGVTAYGGFLGGLLGAAMYLRMQARVARGVRGRLHARARARHRAHAHRLLPVRL